MFTKETLAAWSDLIAGVRSAMILDVMHEFLDSEVPDRDNPMWDVYHTSVLRNQDTLEKAFDAIKKLPVVRVPKE